MPLAVANNSVAPGTLGFLVVAGMAILLVFLFRSMSKHLRKVNAQAREDQETSPAATGTITASVITSSTVPPKRRPAGPAGSANDPAQLDGGGNSS